MKQLIIILCLVSLVGCKEIGSYPEQEYCNKCNKDISNYWINCIGRSGEHGYGYECNMESSCEGQDDNGHRFICSYNDTDSYNYTDRFIHESVVGKDQASAQEYVKQMLPRFTVNYSESAIDYYIINVTLPAGSEYLVSSLLHAREDYYRFADYDQADIFEVTYGPSSLNQVSGLRLYGATCIPITRWYPVYNGTRIVYFEERKVVDDIKCVDRVYYIIFCNDDESCLAGEEELS